MLDAPFIREPGKLRPDIPEPDQDFVRQTHLYLNLLYNQSVSVPLSSTETTQEKLLHRYSGAVSVSGAIRAYRASVTDQPLPEWRNASLGGQTERNEEKASVHLHLIKSVGPYSDLDPVSMQHLLAVTLWHPPDQADITVHLYPLDQDLTTTQLRDSSFSVQIPFSLPYAERIDKLISLYKEARKTQSVTKPDLNNSSEAGLPDWEAVKHHFGQIVTEAFKEGQRPLFIYSAPIPTPPFMYGLEKKLSLEQLEHKPELLSPDNLNMLNMIGGAKQELEIRSESLTHLPK